MVNNEQDQNTGSLLNDNPDNQTLILERVRGKSYPIKNRQQMQVFQRLAEFGYNGRYNQLFSRISNYLRRSARGAQPANPGGQCASIAVRSTIAEPSPSVFGAVVLFKGLSQHGRPGAIALGCSLRNHHI
jgi:hypothetical protein